MEKIEKLLLFLILLFLPTQLGRHFWPDFSYIYSLKIDYLSPTIYFWDLLVLGLVGVWFINKPKINKLALNLLLIFLLSQALSLLGAQNIGAGLVRLEQYVVAGFFGVYLASYNLKPTRFARRATYNLFLPLMLGILFESGLAILQFLKGETLGFWILGERSFSLVTPGIAKFNFYGLEFLRPYGTFSHPNVLAGYMLISIVVLIRLFVIARRESSTDVAIYQIRKIASPLRGLAMTTLKVSGFLVGIAIFLTMSRVAILGGVILLFFLFRKNIKIIIIISIIIVILSPILFTRFGALFSYDSLTFFRREELLQSSWNLFLKNPIFGVGLNNFIPSQEDLIAGPSRFLQPVHNVFLLVLSETGLIGLMGLILLFSPVFKLNPKPYALIPILFLGFFDHYFLTLPQGYRLLFLIWGLSFSSVDKTDKFAENVKRVL